MRVIGEIPHPACKITLFHWNNRYLIKLELGGMEQTFKINEFDLSEEGELYKILDDLFVQQALDRFHNMANSLREAVQRA